MCWYAYWCIRLRRYKRAMRNRCTTQKVLRRTTLSNKKRSKWTIAMHEWRTAWCTFESRHVLLFCKQFISVKHYFVCRKCLVRNWFRSNNDTRRIRLKLLHRAWSLAVTFQLWMKQCLTLATQSHIIIYISRNVLSSYYTVHWLSASIGTSVTCKYKRHISDLDLWPVNTITSKLVYLLRAHFEMCTSKANNI